MKPDGIVCGEPLSQSAFEEVSRRAVLDCFKWNLHDAGHRKLSRFPLVLSRALFEQLSHWAVALDAEAKLAEEELLGRPELFAVLGIPWRLRRALGRASHVNSCRYARYDFHPLDGGGYAITEGNVDVASGFNEGSGVTELFASHVPGTRVAGDPAASVAASVATAVGYGATVGCMHMTNFVDDHQVVRFLERHFEKAGLTSVLFGPSQLRWQNDHAAVAIDGETTRLDAAFRFFPADWLPRLARSTQWWRIFESGGTRWMNPATTILTQSKRFPLVWPKLRTALPTWQRLLPETRSPWHVDDGDWVIKPALAHEGYRVAMSRVTEPATFTRITRTAKWQPRRWAAQRRFSAAPLATPEGLEYPCIGVYVVDGRVAGLYGRIAGRPLIDGSAKDIVLLVQGEA